MGDVELAAVSGQEGSHEVSQFAEDRVLRETRGVHDQTHYPFCGLFAMSSFLELWGKQSNDEPRMSSVPPIDPAYLAVAYNREVGSGSHGSRALWLNYVVSKYGAIPQGSRSFHENRVLWPVPAWRDKHMGLFDVDVADSILDEDFLHKSSRSSFTGVSYLDNVIRINFHDFEPLRNTYSEKTKVVPSQEAPAKLRMDSGADLEKAMESRLKDAGFSTTFAKTEPHLIYELILDQLDQSRPVQLALNPGLVRGAFRNYRLIGTEQLLPEGEGTDESHAMVAVGYCDGKIPRSQMCSQFDHLMQINDVNECVVIQNSWGSDANSKGYLCVSRLALGRMIQTTSILSGLVDDRNRKLAQASP